MTFRQNIFFALSTRDFTPHGTALPGIPIFYTLPNMEILELPTRWMIDLGLGGYRAKSLNTFETYAKELLDWLRTCEANKWPMLEAMQDHIALYRASMLRTKTIFDAPYSAETINGRLNTVARYYEWLTEKRILPAYPFRTQRANVSTTDTGLLGFARGAKETKRRTLNLKRKTSDPAYIPIDPLRKILDGLAERDKLISRWSVATGGRKHEILALDLGQLPSVRNLRGSDFVGMRITITKGMTPRNLRVPVSLLDETERYINGERAAIVRRRKKAKLSCDGEALFLSALGRRLSAKTLWKNFNRQTKAVGVKARFHDLRHTFAIFRLKELQRGLKVKPESTYVPILVLMKELGHRDIKSTAIYLKSIEQDATEVEDVLVSLLNEVDGHELTSRASA
jgi:site-specific recombinase XerD